MVTFQEKSCYYVGEYAWASAVKPSEMRYMLTTNVIAQTKSTWGSTTALEKTRNTEEKQCKTNRRRRKTINVTSLSPNPITFFFIFVIYFFFFMVCYKWLYGPSSFLETQQMWPAVSGWEEGRCTRNTKLWCCTISDNVTLWTGKVLSWMFHKQPSGHYLTN